jgi:hypothetical protein
LSVRLNDSLTNQEKIKEAESIKYKRSPAAATNGTVKTGGIAAIQYANQDVQFYRRSNSDLAVVFVLYRFRQIKHETRIKAGFTKKIHPGRNAGPACTDEPAFYF